MPQPQKPYHETTINKLTTKETTISLTGTVISKEPTAFLLDDSTGTIRCISEQQPSSDYIKVYGTLRPTAGGGYLLDVAFLQDYSTIDKALHKKVQELLQP